MILLQRTTKFTEQALTGTNIINWLRLLRENRFKISWRYIPRALFISLITLSTAPFALFEKIRFGRRIKQTKITKSPVFIIGHWRSGTTLLHSLIIQDQKFAYVSNLHAFLPSIFISCGKLFKPILRRFLPSKRRMDNMPLGPFEPQEEEYAMANISSYSLYHGMAFPQNLKYYSQFCSIDRLPKRTVTKWKKIFKRFLQKITFSSNGKQLILKNPSNTFRVKLLLEMFPDAKFIHIYRNPYEVFLSTLKMYKEMFPYFFLQEPFTDDEGEEFILDLYEEMFEKFFQEKDLIPEGNLIEVKYEDFIQDPIEGLQDIYQTLNLDGFDESLSSFNSYLDSNKEYKRNEHTLDEETRIKVKERWKLTLEKWGYNRIGRITKRLERRGTKREKRADRRKKE
ncbi:MAG: sulfotransferase [Asgard group archaeon]|nr:sulfotransferase [Asgard group archaeon]